MLLRPEGQVILYTVERPWLNNKPNVSCIPEGEYQLVNHVGRKWQNVPRLEGVPGRSFILIHPGNTASDVQGCIAPGMSYSAGSSSVSNSRDAMKIIIDDLNLEVSLDVTVRVVSAHARLDE